MARRDPPEFCERLLSWRLHVGIAMALATCRLVSRIVSDDTIGWFFCAPIGIIGLTLGFRWQIRAGDGS